jgi:hypothetical protein
MGELIDLIVVLRTSSLDANNLAHKLTATRANRKTGRKRVNLSEAAALIILRKARRSRRISTDPQL